MQSKFEILDFDRDACRRPRYDVRGSAIETCAGMRILLTDLV